MFHSPFHGESLAKSALDLCAWRPGITEMRSFRHFNAPLERARRRNKRKALKELRAIGPPPYTAEKLRFSKPMGNWILTV